MILLDNMSNYDRLIGSISRMDSSPLPFEDHPGFYWQGEHSRSADVAVGRTSSHRLPIVGATAGVDYVEIITDYSDSTARDLLKGLGVKDPAEAEIKITTEGDDGRLAGVISFRERQVVASFDVGTFAVKRSTVRQGQLDAIVRIFGLSPLDAFSSGISRHVYTKEEMKKLHEGYLRFREKGS